MLAIVVVLICPINASKPCYPYRYLISTPEHATEAQCMSTMTHKLNGEGKDLVVVGECKFLTGPYRKA